MTICSAFFLALACALVPTPQILAVQHAGTDWINALAFSPDGKVLAAAQGEKILLMNSATRKDLASLNGHSSDITRLAFSPMGDWLASASADQTICLWRVADKTLVSVLRGHERPVLDIVFLDEGRLLASCAADGKINVWKVQNRQLTRTLRRDEPVRSLAYEPKQGFIASAQGDRTVTLWDIRSWTVKKELAKPNFPVTALVFSLDGMSLAGASRKDRRLAEEKWDVHGQPIAPLYAAGEVLLWSIANGKSALLGEHPSVFSLALSPDGALLASAGLDHAIRLWDFKAKRRQATLDDDLGGVTALAFSPEGKMLVSGGMKRVGVKLSGELVFWDLYPGQR